VKTRVFSERRRAPPHGRTERSVQGFIAAREPVRLALLDANSPTGTFSNEEARSLVMPLNPTTRPRKECALAQENTQFGV
jgi:hypothetical protein